MCAMLIGTCGAGNAVRGLSQHAIPDVVVPAEPNENLSLHSAREALYRGFIEVAATTPGRKVLDAANLMASALFIAASFVLLRRRSSAVWWTTQALIANALWAIANVATVSMHVSRHAKQVGVLIDAVIHAQEALLPVAKRTPADMVPAGVDIIHVGLFFFVAAVVLQVLFFLFVGRSINRPEIALFLAAAEREEKEREEE